MISSLLLCVSMLTLLMLVIFSSVYFFFQSLLLLISKSLLWAGDAYVYLDPSLLLCFSLLISLALVIFLSVYFFFSPCCYYCKKNCCCWLVMPMNAFFFVSVSFLISLTLVRFLIVSVISFQFLFLLIL